MSNRSNDPNHPGNRAARKIRGDVKRMQYANKPVELKGQTRDTPPRNQMFDTITRWAEQVGDAPKRPDAVSASKISSQIESRLAYLYTASHERLELGIQLERVHNDQYNTAGNRVYLIGWPGQIFFIARDRKGDASLCTAEGKSVKYACRSDVDGTMITFEWEAKGSPYELLDRGQFTNFRKSVKGKRRFCVWLPWPNGASKSTKTRGPVQEPAPNIGAIPGRRFSHVKLHKAKAQDLKTGRRQFVSMQADFGYA